MAHRLRSIPLILLAALAALVLTACGSDDTTTQGAKASSDTDPQQILKDTFTGKKDVKSGKVDLKIALDAKGVPGASGPISIALSGPFQSQGDGKVPKLDMQLAVTGAGQDVKAGVISTGDKGFVTYNGTSYAVSGTQFKALVAQYEESQKQAKKEAQGSGSLGALGIDPGQWLTNPRNEGETKVGDEQTVTVSGAVNVTAMLDDIDAALAKASSLGLQNAGQLPKKLTAQQRKQVTAALKDPKVEVSTGSEDKILRRLVVTTGIVAPDAKGQSANVKLDLTLSDLNEEQSIEAPKDTKPLDQLLGKLGGLGGLGALGGGSGSGGSGSGGASPGGSAAEQKRLKDYTDCVTKAGSDAGEAQKCASLLTP